ncbi:MAG TPA: response regulator transcription factor [Dehalococcoidia bacterium]|nr:response regulator transcription factor [Dehalococcoidia bacterium]
MSFPPGSAGRCVLVVDDDQEIRRFIQVALTDSGYEVQLAASGAEALRTLGSSRPDLILLDVRMPGVDGWQVLDALRSAAGEQTPVVVMTASFTGQDQALRSGAQGYLAKPFELSDLLACVDLHSRLALDPGMRETPLAREA